MYSTNQRVLSGMGRHRRGMRGLGLDIASTAGSAAGTAIAPGIGTVIGGSVGNFIGSLFGSGPSPLKDRDKALATLFAAAGDVAALQLMQTITQAQAGLGSSTALLFPTEARSYAAQLVPHAGVDPAILAQAWTQVQQYQQQKSYGTLYPMAQRDSGAGGSSSTITIPAIPMAGIPAPITVTLPPDAARTGSVTTIASEVTSVLTYMSQGQSLAQAISTAVAHGEVTAADAASVQALAGQVKSGATTVTYGQAGFSLSSLTSNPTLLLGGIAVLLLMQRKR